MLKDFIHSKMTDHVMERYKDRFPMKPFDLYLLVSNLVSQFRYRTAHIEIKKLPYVSEMKQSMRKISLNSSVYTLASTSGRVSVMGDAINPGVTDLFLIAKPGSIEIR
jgi:hypothetical protein